MSSEKQIKEEKSIANDWAAAQQLEIFKQRFLDPMEERLKKAQKALEDPKFKWESKEQKQRARDKTAEMEGHLDLYRAVYGSTSDLIHQHENLIDLLANSYSAWYNIVSLRGKQMPEMMESQAEELQKIFTDIHKALEPLKLPIKPPKYNNNG